MEKEEHIWSLVIPVTTLKSIGEYRLEKAALDNLEHFREQGLDPCLLKDGKITPQPKKSMQAHKKPCSGS